MPATSSPFSRILSLGSLYIHGLFSFKLQPPLKAHLQLCPVKNWGLTITMLKFLILCLIVFIWWFVGWLLIWVVGEKGLHRRLKNEESCRKR
jgi:hypothetical protein